MVKPKGLVTQSRIISGRVKSRSVTIYIVKVLASYTHSYCTSSVLQHRHQHCNLTYCVSFTS